MYATAGLREHFSMNIFQIELVFCMCNPETKAEIIMYVFEIM